MYCTPITLEFATKCNEMIIILLYYFNNVKCTHYNFRKTHYVLKTNI